MDPTTPVTILLTKPELELLDRAIYQFLTRPEFAVICLRYGLLALTESGDLDMEVEGRIPEFVQKYRDLMARRKRQGYPESE
jgi:hypothetical protein